MRVNPLVCGAVALRTVYAQADSKRVHDSLTGITFSAYISGDTGITFSVTLPMNVSDPYDAIISITAPVSNTTWAGFAWGGAMVWTPLTVAWANGKTTVASPCFALYETPQRSLSIRTFSVG
jgi:hypothetical protein